MSAYSDKPNVDSRLAVLNALEILGAEVEARFERVARLAQEIYGTEIAAVKILERDRAREDSLCAHAIEHADRSLVIADAQADANFADHPHVTGEPEIRFYAGHPIKEPGGSAIGAICVIDSQPRPDVEIDTAPLRDLAAIVEDEIASLSLAITDPLTGRSNRRGFDLLGEQLYSVASRFDLPMAVIYADVDLLKPINDNCGHDAGDRLLIEVADLLQDELRDSDVIARLGGDEFGALLTGAAASDTDEILFRLNEAIAARNAATDEPFEISLSLGAASGRPGLDGESLERIVERADVAMLTAKRTRKAALAR